METRRKLDVENQLELDWKCYRRRYPLHAALIENDFDLAKKVLETLESNEINEKDIHPQKRTPLFCAIQCITDPNERLKICKLLLDHAANMKDLDSSNRDSLHCFFDLENNDDTNEDNLRLIDLFIDRGADVNRICMGETLLHKCVDQGKSVFVKKLLANGAADNIDSLALLSVKNEDVETFQCLLVYNANVNNAKAFAWALMHNYSNILKLMFDYGADLKKMGNINQLMRYIVSSYYTYAYVFLLDHGFDIDAYGNQKLSLLREMYDKFMLSHVKWMTDRKGSDPTDEYDKTMFRLKKLLKRTVIETKINHDASIVSFLKLTFLREIYKGYRKQVNRMKATRVLESSLITYFDLVSKKGKSLILLCEEKIVAETLKNKYLFPDFEEDLERIVRRGSFQRNILKNFREALGRIFEKKLPFDLICSICDYLEIKDLIAFALRDT